MHGDDFILPSVHEHFFLDYDALPRSLDIGALAHLILLMRDWLRRKRHKLSGPAEAELIARLYDYWLAEHQYPNDQVIARLRGLIKD